MTPLHDSGSDPGAPSALERLAAFVGGWIPPLAAFGLFCHLCLLGLAPARAERDRLESAAARLDAEHVELEARLEQLRRLERAQADPVYVERVRRLERTPPAPLEPTAAAR